MLAYFRLACVLDPTHLYLIRVLLILLRHLQGRSRNQVLNNHHLNNRTLRAFEKALKVYRDLLRLNGAVFFETEDGQKWLIKMVVACVLVFGIILLILRPDFERNLITFSGCFLSLNSSFQYLTRLYQSQAIMKELGIAE